MLIKTDLFVLHFSSLSLYLQPQRGPDGEIGRHATLRGWCRLRCASSSLVLGTGNLSNLAISLLCLLQNSSHTQVCSGFFSCASLEIAQIFQNFRIISSLLPIFWRGLFLFGACRVIRAPVHRCRLCPKPRAHRAKHRSVFSESFKELIMRANSVTT